MRKPIVSICCITYNHSSFIRKAIDGFLIQEPPSSLPKDTKLSDWCEILIHDDCSMDGTDAIIREYAAKYPDVIYPLYEDVNQFCSIGASKIDLFNYNRAIGKYIAYCEGDDYWTDPKKLQKQVDFMEKNPEYSVTWTRCIHHDCDNDLNTEDNCGFLFSNKDKGVDVTREMFFSKWITQPLTMVFRRDAYSNEWMEQYKYYKDMHEMYHLLGVGKGYLFSFNSGVYNVHSSGIFSKLNLQDACSTVLKVAEELYKNNRELTSQKNYERVLQWNIDNAKKINTNKFTLSWKLFVMNRNIKQLIKNIIRK